MDLCFAKECFLFDQRNINPRRYGNPDDGFVHGRDGVEAHPPYLCSINKCDETGLFVEIVYPKSYRRWATYGYHEHPPPPHLNKTKFSWSPGIY